MNRVAAVGSVNSETPLVFAMIEPRSDRVPATQTKHHCYQVIRTTRVHQSSRSSRMVTVQEKVIRSRLQLGYSTPTNFINRYLPLFHSSTIRKTIQIRVSRVSDPIFPIDRAFGVPVSC